MKRLLLVSAFCLITLVTSRADAAAPTPLTTPPPALANSPGVHVAPGKFEGNWDSLTKGYQCPEWFRNAKFGIWAHWSAQCVPEQGDWYARSMYIEGDRDYKFHARTYGAQSAFGFKDLDNAWKAEKWDPEKLMALYARTLFHGVGQPPRQF